MITYLQHTEIDLLKWDLCVEQASNSMIYGCSWYLDVVSPGWDALISGDYEAVMPLTHKRKYAIRYIAQPFFTQQLGVFSKLPVTQAVVMEFLKAIPRKFRFVEMQLNEQNEILPESTGFRRRKNYLLDLSRAYDKIAKDYSKQAKGNLRKARTFNHTLKTIPYHEVVSFYKLYKGLSTKGVRDEDYGRLTALMEQAYSRKKLLARGIYSADNELLAAAAFLTHRSRLVFLLGTASPAGRDEGAMYYLFDNLIHHFSSLKMVFDFEGSEIPGIARFFKSFGAAKHYYHRLKINRLPWWVRMLKH